MHLNLDCPINDRSYGLASLEILRALTELGHDISLFPIGIQDGFQQIPEVQQGLIRAQTWDYNAPSVRIFHQFSLAPRYSRKLNAALIIFELDEFNETELHHMRSVDILFVCSKWAKTVVEKYLTIPCHVVPLGVDRSIFNEEVKSSFKDNITRFFLCGKLEVRKSHDIAHEIFNKAFTKSDRVELVVSWENPFLAQSEIKRWRDMYLGTPLGSKIRFAPWLTRRQDLAILMMGTDCGLFLSRAEGFNLPALEYLSLGKYIIASNYSGHTEFCTPENSYLFDFTEFPIAYDSHWFTSGIGHWGDFTEDTVDQIVEYMRAFYKLHQEGQLQQNTAGIETAQQFSWAASAQKLVNALTVEWN